MVALTGHHEAGALKQQCNFFVEILQIGKQSSCRTSSFCLLQGGNLGVTCIPGFNATMKESLLPCKLRMQTDHSFTLSKWVRISRSMAAAAHSSSKSPSSCSCSLALIRDGHKPGPGRTSPQPSFT